MPTRPAVELALPSGPVCSVAWARTLRTGDKVEVLDQRAWRLGTVKSITSGWIQCEFFSYASGRLVQWKAPGDPTFRQPKMLRRRLRAAAVVITLFHWLPKLRRRLLWRRFVGFTKLVAKLRRWGRRARRKLKIIKRLCPSVLKERPGRFVARRGDKLAPAASYLPLVPSKADAADLEWDMGKLSAPASLKIGETMSMGSARFSCASTATPMSSPRLPWCFSPRSAMISPRSSVWGPNSMSLDTSLRSSLPRSSMGSGTTVRSVSPPHTPRKPSVFCDSLCSTTSTLMSMGSASTMCATPRGSLGWCMSPRSTTPVSSARSKATPARRPAAWTPSVPGAAEKPPWTFALPVHRSSAAAQRQSLRRRAAVRGA